MHACLFEPVHEALPETPGGLWARELDVELWALGLEFRAPGFSGFRVYGLGCWDYYGAAAPRPTHRLEPS